MTDIDPRFTFETFVVGPANRLASAAARRAADSPGTSYNPLFIYASSGLGKSHILSAIAHHATRVNARNRVHYQTLEGYLEELAYALEGGHRDAMKDRYRELDVLLLDDVQFLTGQPEAQEMLLSTLDALTASGSQIVLASDRPPADINGLDARLLSRFSGGLIVDIAAPEYETRVAIIRKKVDEQGQTLQQGVAEALARYPFRNVRELGGSLNRILAIQDLEERSVRAEEIASLMGDGSGAPKRSADSFDNFMDELSETVATTVEVKEEAWRKAFREMAEAAEGEGYSAARLRGQLEGSEPDGWEATVEQFKSDVTRMREIEDELHQLQNPWPEAAAAVVKDPERLEEAESLLDSVRERMRPFPRLAQGPRLEDLKGSFTALALKAAEQLIAPDRPKYNPLYLWSASGEAPQTILGAAGRTFQARAQAGDRMAVTSVSEFAEDFIRALSAGVAGAWRERWWTVDLLLVHGAEALTGTERAQDEFFHLFEALKRRGSRVLLVADRPPTGIEGIDERLRSRFEGGLVLEVESARLPPGAGQLVFEVEQPVAAAEAEWGALPAAMEVDQAVHMASAPDRGGIVPPLEDLIGEGRRGLFNDPSDSVAQPGRAAVAAEPPAAGAEAETPLWAWMPSREKVVWNWPVLEDRLVEELE